MRILPLGLATAAALSLSACTSMLWSQDEPTFAERLASIEEDWREGQDDIERGEKMVSEGQEKLVENRRRRERRLASLDETEVEMESLRVEIARSATNTDPRKLEDMTERLRRLEKYAEEHAEEAEDAEDDIRDARRRIERGQNLIERGERMVREAERQYFEDASRSITNSGA